MIMKDRKWFDVNDGAKFLGIQTNDLYAIIRNRELELKDYLSRVPNKRMISREGLNYLIKNK